MKPCYRQEDKLYLLAHIIKEGDQFQQPRKALICPGKCPEVTRATLEFIQICGWNANPTEQDSVLATKTEADSSKGTDRLVRCKLMVGSCQLSTALQVVENVDFAGDCALSNWHIHIGRKDYEALQRNAWDSDVCYLAAKSELGRLASPPKCSSSCDGLKMALITGHSECFSYWHTHVMHRQHEDDFIEGLYYAAELPTAEILMYGHDVFGIGWPALVCAVAAEAGSIECLSYAHVSGCPWHPDTCSSAAATGNLPCLAYAHEHGCEWGGSVLHDAARNGHLNCLKYAHTHGCPYIASRPDNSYWYRSNPFHLTTQTVHASSMPCLVYVRKVMGCPWDPDGGECTLAFQKGNLELLQYVHSHGGVLCTEFEQLLGPDTASLSPKSIAWLNAVGNDAERRTKCLLYVLCYGRCQVKGIWHTKIGQSVLESVTATREAVLLSFHTAGKAHVEDTLIAAAHAAMVRMPNDIVQEIICTAGLQPLN